MDSGPPTPPQSPGRSKPTPSFSFGTAAFILIRVKRAFKKKRAKRKSSPKEGTPRKRPLIRSRTLPSIVVPEFLEHRDGPGTGTSHRVAPSEQNVRPLVKITNHDGTAFPFTDDTKQVSYAGGSPGGLRVPGTTSQSSSLGRIARLLTKDSRTDEGFRRRTHSLESKLGPSMRKAASIDSLVDATNNNIAHSKKSLPGKLIMPGSPLQPKRSFSKPDRSSYLSPGWSNMDVLVDGLNLTKADKKRQEKLEKINKINIHLQALFAAVEHGQLEKAKNILQNNTFEINSVNDDGFNVLEVAVMCGYPSIVRLLQQTGAIETNTDEEEHMKKLAELILTAECRWKELANMISTAIYPKEIERQHAIWERRAKTLRRMKNGLEKLKISGPPKCASVEVIDGTRVRVSFHEPFSHHSTITTKFKVEWSTDEWETTAGSVELFDLRRMSAVIEGLQQGQRHHFRVYAGNMKGLGTPIETSPPSAVPSSWRDIDNRKSRIDGLLRDLDDLFNQVRNSRPEHASEIKTIEPGQETPIVQRKAAKKKSLMHLFTHAPKFHKNLKRGSYFSCIVFCEDKVLLTTEDFPPVVEVDENYLSQAKLHFHWLMKVATTWEDVKSLRQDMEQAGSASHVPYRIMFLQAAANMQSALGIQDIGQFYHKPIKDASGTHVFCTVKHVKSTKTISAMNVRWVPLSKLRDRRMMNLNSSPQNGDGLSNVSDLLYNSIEEQITYSQVSQIPLRRGLYLGYLKLQSLVDQLQVIVPSRMPNMFPHVKIRDNPHISREEWEWVQKLSQDSLSTSEDPGGGYMEDQPMIIPPKATQAQQLCQQQLLNSIQALLQDTGVPEELWSKHRLYTAEVIELNCDVTILLLLPPIEAVCCAPGQEDALLLRPGYIALPLHTFEMIHMGTYQGHLLSRYARLSYILEMDLLMAQHASREAFSENEVTTTKVRLQQLKQFQVHVDNVWKKFRWVMDAITFAREKNKHGLPLTSLSENLLMSAQSRKVSLSYTSTDFVFPNAEVKERKHVNKYKKKAQHRIPKSHTSDSIKTIDSPAHRIPKSKTSECVFRHSPCDEEPFEPYIAKSPTVNIHWQAQDTDRLHVDNRMYTKNDVTAKSECLLQCAELCNPPPRKSSAPSFLGLNVNSLQSMTPSTSSASLDHAKSDKTYLNASLPLSTQSSPTASRRELSSPDKLKRTCSNLSHESEASCSSVASLRSSSTDDRLSVVSKDSVRSESSDVRSPCEDDKKKEEPAIIQVYAAYETGLAAGTSVRLHITPRTTTREVIDLVVKQLNMAVILKHLSGPIYGNDKLKDFCLVAVIGARERCLRDDFKPLNLQNPWRKGRLYVRLKQAVLAALEQSNSRHSSYL